MKMERSLIISHQPPLSSFSPAVHCRLRHRPLTHTTTISTNAAGPSVPPYSSSEDSEDSNKNRNLVVVDLEELAAAEESIAQQQAAGLPPPYDLAATKVKKDN
jgi:hypothetical protein